MITIEVKYNQHTGSVRVQGEEGVYIFTPSSPVQLIPYNDRRALSFIAKENKRTPNKFIIVGEKLTNFIPENYKMVKTEDELKKILKGIGFEKVQGTKEELIKKIEEMISLGVIRLQSNDNYVLTEQLKLNVGKVEKLKIENRNLVKEIERLKKEIERLKTTHPEKKRKKEKTK